MDMLKLIKKAAGRLLGSSTDSAKLNEISIIKESFDSAYYLDNYPEVNDTDLSPIEHFLQIGWKKNYNPNNEFSTAFYLDAYSDVKSKGVNPFVHYVRHGKKEGRQSKRGASSSSLYSIDEIKDLIKKEFDEVFYAKKQLGRAEVKGDELDHFVMKGWREGLDPNENFSVDYYLSINPDIKSVGLNPFFHYLRSGRNEGRNPVGLFHSSKRVHYKPRVTAIVPNYNHEKYLAERIDSILNQSYSNIDIILLDDCSSDNSVEVLKAYEEKYPDKIKAIINTDNSGNVFRQWKKGIEAAEGEFIWICESDDTAEPNFVANLIPYFLDRAAMIVFGKIQFMTQDGKFMEGLDGFRDGAKPGIWNETQIRPANEWFNGPFGIRNIIPNVGGCIFRNQTIPDNIWDEAQSYKILGDWYLYSKLSNGGNIVFEPRAVSYFRQHGKNTSVKSFKTLNYYEEHYRFILQLKKQWDVKEATLQKFFEYTKWQYIHHFGKEKEADFDAIFDFENLKNTEKTQKHILIGFLGFHVGGAEIFPIHLASELVNIDEYSVSMIALDRNDEVEDIIAQLDKRIAVYSSDILKQKGINRFIDNAAIDIINTHNIGLEFKFLIGNENPLATPYVVTLHGSYEVTNLMDSHLIELLRKVTHWIYTADRNLSHLEGIPLSDQSLTKVSNAMAMTDDDFVIPRKSLGIKEDAFVFGLMARTIEEKGWEEGILATIQVVKKTQKDVHLLLVGDGGVQPALVEKYGSHPNIHFLGFQSNVHGFFRICDCCLLPTKFKGESNPLVLIQSMQVDTPIVSVDIGEIKTMLYKGNKSSGIAVPYIDDKAQFVNALSESMIEMLDPLKHKVYATNAHEFGKEYAISKVAQNYQKIFNQVISQFKHES